MVFRVIPLLTIAIAHHYTLGLWVDSSQEPEKRHHNSIKAEETLDVISKVSKWQKCKEDFKMAELVTGLP